MRVRRCVCAHLTRIENNRAKLFPARFMSQKYEEAKSFFPAGESYQTPTKEESPLKEKTMEIIPLPTPL